MSSFDDSTSPNQSGKELEDQTETDSFAPFKKYFSIRNSYVTDEVAYSRQFVPAEEEWVAMEKVHGCNFSATTK